MAKVWEQLNCLKCGKTFTPYASKQRYCQNPCTTKSKRMTISEANQAWLQRDKRNTIKRKNQIGMRFLEN